MPTMPPRHRAPGAPTYRQAEAKRKADLDKRRGSMAERGYDRDWYRFRAAFLKVNPICCCGCRGRAQVVDHIKTIRERPDLRLVASNCRPMTKACHDRHTALTQGFARKGPREKLY